MSDAATATPAAAPAAAPKPADATGVKDPLKEALREVLHRLERDDAAARFVPEALRRQLREIADAAATGGGFHDPRLRHRLAYAIQDIERTPVGRVPIAEGARLEVDRLAAGAPGLTNRTLREILGTTSGMADQRAVTEVRKLAWGVGRLADQDTPDVASQVDALDNRLRLARRGPGEDPVANAAPPSAAPVAERAGPSAAERAASAAQQQPVAPTGGAASAGAPAAGATGNFVLRESGLAALLRGRGATATEAGPPPWEAAAVPLAERIGGMNAQMVRGAEHQRIESAERAGRAALDTVAAFRATAGGAEVMGKITAAAKNDPGGLEGVLSGMREGGRYEDLRRAFNATLARDNAASVAHDRAAAAVARYGERRAEAVPLVARQPDAARIAERLQKLDAEIGGAAGATPDREEGATLASRLGERAAEIVRRAVEAVKALFGRGAAATADAGDGPRPSPSPGP